MIFFKNIKLPSDFNKRWVNYLQIPTIDVRTVEQYFSLPKSQREYFGMYKTPFALPSEMFDKTIEGWDTFYFKIRQEYPIQYFFRYWLLSLDNPLCLFFSRYIIWPLAGFKRSVNLWFNPIHPRWRASLPRHKYCDVTELVVISNFALIQDFYWEEVVDGFVDWTADEPHRAFHSKLVTYIQWIEHDIPKLKEQLTQSISNASSTPLEGGYYEKYKESISIEKEIQDRETEILIWFAENRGFFWS